MTRRLNHAATPSEIRITTRAKDGAPEIKWLAQVWIVAGRFEIDIFKNGHEWGESIAPAEVLSTLRMAGSHKSHPYIARKVTNFAEFVVARAA